MRSSYPIDGESGLQQDPRQGPQEWKSYPLSFAQSRIWFLSQLAPDSPAYNLPVAIRLEGLLNTEALALALRDIAGRHEVLRSTFHRDSSAPGEAAQRVYRSPSAADLPVVDLRGLSDSATRRYARQLARREAQIPFRLHRDAPWRCCLILEGRWRYVLLVTMHHVASDGWSLTLLMDELAALYRTYAIGDRSALPRLSMQYGEYALWQRQWLAGGELERQLDYWLPRLEGAPQVLELPFDRPRPVVQSFRGGSVAVRLDEPLTAACEALAREHKTTLYAVLLSAWAALLHRLSGQDDLLLGTPVAGRENDDVRSLIGVFVNTLVLRSSIGDGPTFEALVQRLSRVVRGAQTHQDMPFEHLVEQLQPERNLGYNPIFQVLFTFQNTPQAKGLAGTTRSLGELTLAPIEGGDEAAQFDLVLTLGQEDAEVRGEMVFSTDLLDPTTARRWARIYRRLLSITTAEEQRLVLEPDLLSQAQRHQLLLEWNDGAVAVEPAAVPQRVLHQARRRAADTAVITESGSNLTYGELTARAAALALRLESAGVEPEQPVLVICDRGAESLIALLGTMMAGAAYVPLDPSHPLHRLQLIVGDSGARVAVVDAVGARLAADQLELDSVLEIQPVGAAADPGSVADDFALPAGAGSLDSCRLAYVLYTSGSTGRPKGVEVSHGALDAFLQAMSHRPGLAPEDRILALTPLTFDIAALELLLPLVLGATVVMASTASTRDGEALLRLMEEHRVTAMQGTPASWRLVTEAGGPPPGLRRFCGGEALGSDLAHLLRKGDGELWNLYGPTETTVWSTRQRVEGVEGSGWMPIGRPIEGTAVYCVGPWLQPLPLGAVGELVIAGRGLARGYRGRPALTADRFRPDPFSGRGGARLYRTGDRCRQLADGRFHFLGRFDHQVKIRGFRIELGEIESALRELPGVADAVAAVHSLGGGDRLVAYLSPAPESSAKQLQERRDELLEPLRQRLPEVMVPQEWVVLPALPLNANGKVDRGALPKPELAAADVVTPRSEVERCLAELWAEILDIEAPGVHRSFFDLGGHSLLLMRLRRSIEERFQQRLELVDLFRHPTIASLAERLASTQGDEEDGEGAGAAGLEPSLARRRRPQESSGAIAIVGLAGRFPGAADLDQLWALLVAGQSGIRRFSESELLEAGIRAELVADPRYVPARAVLDDVERFDAELFDVLPRDAELLDPQHRLFLETSWQALESAGYDPKNAGATGVFAGSSASSYWLHVQQRQGMAGGFQTLVNNDKDFLATRVAFKLGLRGPAVTVQTACSTSLVAIHLAAESLRRGECGMALAGGVSVGYPRVTGYRYTEGMILSPDGECRAFDAAAKGTVSGEGVGVVVLKRLVDARRDGDVIRAVLAGSAINNDGSEKMSFTAPSAEGQSAVICAALEMAGVAPETISYVEAHGTGTPLGDPIEVAALTQALGVARTADGSGCALGSIKTNIGHLDAAAGVAGLIKTVLCLERGALPPSRNFHTPNPAIDFASGGFDVVQRATPWPAGKTPRRAGVSSFGIGGTNAHAILEEAPQPPPRETSTEAQLLLLSARTESALERMTDRLAQHLRESTTVDLRDVAHTLQRGRHSFSHRRALWASDGEAAAEILERRDGARLRGGLAPENVPTVAFLFPGQGAQRPGMAAGLYRHEPLFRELFDQALGVLRDDYHGDTASALERRLLWAPESATERETAAAQAAIERTELAQPALFVVAYGLARCLEERGLRPDAMIGHSIGEMVAACLAGVLSFEDAVRTVARRGQWMGELPRGAMLAAPLSREQAEAFIAPGRSLAAVNAPSRVVFSGTEEAMEALRQKLDQLGVRSRPLRTSHGFHSECMDPMLERFREFLRSLDLKSPRRPYISTLTGTWIRPEEATSVDYWVRHLREPVRFAEGAAEILSSPRRVMVEVGPGRALTNFLRQLPEARRRTVVPALGNGDRVLDDAVADLWLAGCEVRWRRPEGSRRVPLPTYPFEGGRFGPEAGAAAPALVARSAAQRSAAEVEGAPAAISAGAATPAAGSAAIAELPPVASTVLGIVERLAGVPAEQIEWDVPFPEAGVDSLLLVQFSQALEEEIGRTVPLARLMDDLSTLRTLTAHLLGTEAAALELPVAAVAAVTAPGAASGAASEAGPGAMARSTAASAPPPAPPPAAECSLSAGSGSAPGPSSGPPTASSTGPVPEPVQGGEDVGRGQALGPFQPLDIGGDEVLTPRQQRALEALVAGYTERTRRSKALADQQREVWADNRASVDFRMLWKELVYQITVERSRGSRLWDVDGNEYLDFAMGFGVNLFGHAPDFIFDALGEQLEAGIHLGPQSDIAGEVAASIARLTGVERVTFANTGTEAVMTALRLARATTGRDRIAMFSGSYHGTSDVVLARGTLTGAPGPGRPLAPGIPINTAKDILVLPYGEDSALDAIEELGGELAAVLVEPVQSRRPDLQPRRFLHQLRKITEESGSALIFDEVITGFRIHPGGAQAWFGIEADLVTYGKVVGGGMPVGVVAGSGRYMDAIDGGVWRFGDRSYPQTDKTFFAGTFCKHPLTMAAARAALQRMEERGPKLQDELNQRTARLAIRLNAFFRDQDVPLEVVHFGSLFRIVPPPGALWANLFFYYLLLRGIFTWEGRTCFLSTVHSEEDLERLGEAVQGAVVDLRQGGFLPGGEGGSSAPSGGRAGDVAGAFDGNGESASPAAPQSGSLPPTDPHHRADLAADCGGSQRAPEPAALQRVPATPAQQQLWALTQQDEDTARAYHEAVVLDLRGTLDRRLLELSLSAVAARHAALRGRFDPSGEVLVIAAAAPVELPTVDLSGLEELGELAAGALKELTAEASRRLFPTESAAFRLHHLCLGNSRHRVVLTCQHAILDGRSIGLLISEMMQLYGAGQGTSSAALAQSRPLMALQEAESTRQLDEERSRQALEHWTEELRGVLPPLFPTDRPRGSFTSFRGGFRRFDGGQTLHRAALELAARRRVTLAAVMLAAYGALLHRLTGSRELVIGVPSTSAVGEGQPVLGFFLAVLPVASRLESPFQSFSDFLAGLQRKLLVGYEHRYVSINELAQALGLERALGRHPLVVTVCNVDRAVAKTQLGDLEMEVHNNPTGGTRFEVILNVTDRQDTLLLESKYCSDLYDEATVERWLRALAHLLQAASERPRTPVLELPWIGAAERHQCLMEWNDTDRRRGEGSREVLQELFLANARRQPEALAVLDREGSQTYRQLERESARLAAHLRSLGLGRGDVVGIHLRRSRWMVVAALAVCRSGAAYVPLADTFPAARRTLILERLGCRCLITDAAVLESEGVAAAATLKEVVLFGGAAVSREIPGEARGESTQEGADDASSPPPWRRWDFPQLAAAAADWAEGDPTTAGDLAYVIFTSGSTGEPKGVMVHHRPAVNLVHWVNSSFGVGSSDRVLFVTALTFDLSVYDIFGLLAAGGSIRVATEEELREPQHLVDALRAEPVTIWDSAPAALQQLTPLLPEPGTVDSAALRLVLLSGDWIPVAMPDRVRGAFPGARLIAMGGATEATVWSNVYEVGEVDTEWSSIPYGRPIFNAQYYVLEAGLRPCPIGVAGDLYIAGSCLAAGYAEDPRLTAVKFLPDPWSRQLGGRLYATGDRARFGADGNIEFLGRLDAQVKVRGYRIELGEIESHLASHPAVADVVVLAREDLPGRKQLVAYVVAESGAVVLDAAELSAHVAARVPTYMVPSHLVLLDRLPVTANGKLDRRALPAPEREESPPTGRRSASPRNAIETTLVEVWSQLLQRPVGIHDRFLELGGDSVLAIQAVARAARAGVRFTAIQLYEKETVAALAAVATRIDEKPVEVAEVTGAFPLTPIQHWLLEVESENFDHFNQSLMLAVAQDLVPVALETALGALIAHHDALRLRLERQPSASGGISWEQRILPLESPPAAPLITIDLSEIAPRRRAAELEDIAEATQRSLRVERGPMLRMVYATAPREQYRRLLLVIHHLVVDGISWRILLEDLQRAYEAVVAGRAPELPAKTTSFPRWSHLLQELAERPESRTEASYWRAQQRVAAELRLPVDESAEPGENTVASLASTTAVLSPESTELLLQQAPAAYRTEINDLLLTALALAMAGWTGEPRCWIELESHGRQEDLFEGVDLSRTVGWFTYLYPVLLDLSSTLSSRETGAGGTEGVDLRAAVLAVKAQLRAVPRRGVGYGLLRYLLPLLRESVSEPGREVAAAAAPRPQLLFNYLGRLDSALPQDSPFLGAPESAGSTRAESFSRAHLLEIDSFVTGGRLHVTVRYSAAFHRSASVKALAASMVERLEELTEHCVDLRHGGLIEADLPLAKLDSGALNRLMESVATADGVSPAAAARNLEDAFPLSPLQHHLLLAAISAGRGGGVGFEQIACTLEGALHLDLFVETWQRIAAHHQALRLAFVTDGLDRPLQVARRRVEVPVKVEDWRDVAAGEWDQRFQRRIAADRELGFDLSEAPLMRVTLVRSSASRWGLIWSHHHLVLDGWCRTRVLGEVLSTYRSLTGGEEPQLGSSRPFGDFAGWLEKQDPGRSREFWQRSLSGLRSVTDLMLDRRPRGQRQQGFAQLSKILDGDRLEALEALGRRGGATLSTLFQAAWGVLLSRLHGGGDALIGATVSGRPGELEQADSMVGMFINNLPVRVPVPESEPLSSWLDSFQRWQLELRQHEHTAAEQIQEWSDLPWGRRLFDSLVVFQNYPLEIAFQESAEGQESEGSTPAAGRQAEGADGLDLRLHSATLETNYPLTLVINPGAGLTVDLVFDRQHLDEPTVDRLGEALTNILGQMAAAEVDLPVSALSPLSMQQRRQLSSSRPRGSAGDEETLSVPVQIVEVARLEWESSKSAAPREIAAWRAAGESLSFTAILGRAGDLASRLRQRGLTPGSVVAVTVAERHAALAYLGVLLAGGACLPAPRPEPEVQGEIALWLTDGSAEISATWSGTTLCWEPAQVSTEQDTEPGAEPLVAGSLFAEPPQWQLAWVGVLGEGLILRLSHGALARALAGGARALELSSGEGVSIHAPLDPLAAAAWLMPWTRGAGLQMLPTDGEIHRERSPEGQRPAVTVLAAGTLPAQLESLAADVDLPRRRAILLWGGPPTAALLRAASRRCSRLVVNAVGQWGFERPLEGGEEHDLRPHLPAETGARVLDPAGRDLMVGGIGELFVPAASGETLGRAQGTLGPDSESRAPAAESAPWRPTELWARRLESGEVEILGAAQAPVLRSGLKIRGAEVEALLGRHRHVLGAVVVPSGSGDRSLAAWVVSTGGEPIPAAELHLLLRRDLPAAAIPETFHFCESLPLTPEGRFDRRAMVEAAGPGSTAPRVPPRNAVEVELLKLWEELFELRPLGVRDSFFDLGGHSLLALRLITNIRGRFGRDLPLRALLEGQTVEGIALHLQEDAESWSPLVQLSQGSADRPPLFCAHPAGGDVLGYLQLARRLEGITLYGLRGQGAVEGQRPIPSVEAMAATYIEVMREVQPRGPYRVAGHSFGGYLAVEIGHQLRQAGETVDLVALFDTDVWNDDTEPDPKDNLEILAREMTGGAIQSLPRELDLEDQLAWLLDQLTRQGTLPPGFGLREARQFFDLYWNDIQAAFHYEPPTFDGSLLIFRAKEQTHDGHADDESLGWSQLASSVRVIHVDGDHYNLLRQPQVERLARCLSEHLEAIDDFRE
ncbi:MAG: amino acid adenylation domain-containing protein [Acidobacteriota bacterium]